MQLKRLGFVLAVFLWSTNYADTAYLINNASPDGTVYSFTTPVTGAVPPPPINILDQSLSSMVGIVISLDASTLYILDKSGNIYQQASDGSTASTLLVTLTLGPNDQANAIAISPNGLTLYVVLYDTVVPESKIISLPIATPATQTLRATSAASVELSGISIDVNGNTGYVVQKDTPYDLFSFNTAVVAGSLTTIPVVPPFIKSFALATIDATNLVVTDGADLIKVTTGGAATTIGQTAANGFRGVAVSIDKQNIFAIDVGTTSGGNTITPIYKVPVSGVNDPGVVVATILYKNGAGITMGPSTAPPPGPPTTSLLPPSNLQGSSHRVGILGGDSFYNQLEWDVPFGGVVPTTGYRVYRNGVLVVELSPETFTWIDLNTPQNAGTSTTYSLVSVAGSSVSAPIFVTVTRV